MCPDAPVGSLSCITCACCVGIAEVQLSEVVTLSLIMPWCILLIHIKDRRRLRGIGGGRRQDP